jgi:hypothetical protein
VARPQSDGGGGPADRSSAGSVLSTVGGGR